MRVIIFVINFLYALFLRLGDFPKILLSLFQGWNLLFFSIVFLSLSLTMHLPYTLSLFIPFTSLYLSLSLISPSLSISLPPSLYLSFYLSLSPPLSFFSLSFSLSSLYHSLWRIYWTFRSLFILKVKDSCCVCSKFLTFNSY